MGCAPPAEGAELLMPLAWWGTPEAKPLIITTENGGCRQRGKIGCNPPIKGLWGGMDPRAEFSLRGGGVRGVV